MICRGSFFSLQLNTFLQDLVIELLCMNVIFMSWLLGICCSHRKAVSAQMVKILAVDEESDVEEQTHSLHEGLPEYSLKEDESKSDESILPEKRYYSSEW